MAQYNRRAIIRGTGLALVGVLAGCSDDDGGTGAETATETSTETVTATRTAAKTATATATETATQTMTATETVTATDTVTATPSVTATITPSGDRYMDAFRQGVAEDLDIDVMRFEKTDGVVEIVYESSYEAYSRAGGEQMGYLGGFYAGLVDQGWETDALRAEFTDGEGVTYRFEVKASDAQDYASGAITEDEFIDIVFDSLTQVEN